MGIGARATRHVRVASGVHAQAAQKIGAGAGQGLGPLGLSIGRVLHQIAVFGACPWQGGGAEAQRLAIGAGYVEVTDGIRRGTGRFVPVRAPKGARPFHLPGGAVFGHQHIGASGRGQRQPRGEGRGRDVGGDQVRATAGRGQQPLREY